jgi:hypothetical protein
MTYPITSASVLLVVGLAACSASAPWPASGIYTGYYVHGYELSEFIPTGTKEKWWLTGAVPRIPQYTKDNVGTAPKSNPVRYISVRGTLSAEGKHGHLGAYSREVTAQQVLECRELLPTEKPNL